MPCVLYLIEILHQTTTFVRVEFDELMLYLIEILHQTTTEQLQRMKFARLYLIEILHQTTTFHLVAVSGSVLYLIEILHQTTTHLLASKAVLCCILSKFYIKPQPIEIFDFFRCVVSYRNSTSNHNSRGVDKNKNKVVSYRNSTSNHNRECGHPSEFQLYLIEILHQTTTRKRALSKGRSCILSKFYIKPQR